MMKPLTADEIAARLRKFADPNREGVYPLSLEREDAAAIASIIEQQAEQIKNLRAELATPQTGSMRVVISSELEKHAKPSPRRSRLMKKHKPLILRGELTTGAYKGWHVLSRTKSNQEVVVRDLSEAIVIVKAMSTEPPK